MWQVRLQTAVPVFTLLYFIIDDHRTIAKAESAFVIVWSSSPDGATSRRWRRSGRGRSLLSTRALLVVLVGGRELSEQRGSSGCRPAGLQGSLQQRPLRLLRQEGPLRALL